MVGEGAVTLDIFRGNIAESSVVILLKVPW